ncbi:MAG: MlaD family protein [Burkholderiales bacterium]|jgi:phospholipid/cholesterol/gamma-HCH transport system substrate-binding protein
MKDNRQYLVVGLFVIISIAILVSVWLWFSASNRKAYNTYLAIFTEPVDGITTNSVIKYNGVEVGQVKQIELDSKNPQRILVYLNVLQNVPISANTYATMKPQGITGLSYIDLRLPHNVVHTSNLVPHNSPPYPEIPTRPSLLYSLTEQAQSLTNNVQDISGQVKIILNDKNVDHLSHILSNLDKVSASVASHSNEIGQSLAILKEVLTNVKQNTDNLNATFKDIAGLTETLSQTTENANQLISNVQNNTLQNVNSVLLPNLNRTITHLNQSSYQLEQFLTLLNQNPSALVRGKTPPKPGPGE